MYQALIAQLVERLLSTMMEPGSSTDGGKLCLPKFNWAGLQNRASIKVEINFSGLDTLVAPSSWFSGKFGSETGSRLTERLEVRQVLVQTCHDVKKGAKQKRCNSAS